MRKTCRECAQKHIMTAAVYLTRAAVLFKEEGSNHEYEHYFNQAVGELGEAIDELSRNYLSEAVLINKLLDNLSVTADCPDLLEAAMRLDALPETEEEQ